MKKLMSFCVVISICLLLAGALLAQETGEISGKIVDEDGVGLPGVSVTASSPKLQGKRATLGQNDGTFRLSLLPVGLYDVTYKLQGFTTISHENVKVSLAMRTSINVTMKISTIEEQMTVVAEVPLIDITESDTSFRVGTKELSTLPVQGRTIQEIYHYAPGVTGVRNNTNKGVGGGGVSFGAGSFRGEGKSGNNWLVDGLSKRTSLQHTEGVRVNYDSWEEVQVISDGFSPELGQALGGIINIVTKSGGNAFHGELGGLILSQSLRAGRKEQIAYVVEPNTSTYNYFGNIGGPIIRDKLWFFISNNYWHTADDGEAGSIGWLTIPEGHQRTNTNNFFGKLTYSPIQNHTLSFSGTFDTFLNQTGGFGLPELYQKTDYEDYAYRLNYKAILGPNTLIEAAVGRSSLYNSRRPLSDDLDSPAINYLDIGQWTGNQRYLITENDKRSDFTSRFTQYINTEKYGNHEIGLGFSYYYMFKDKTRDSTGQAWDLWPGNGVDAGSYIVYTEQGAPYQMTERVSQINTNSSRGFGIYLKDKITFGRFSVLLGLRSETQKVYNDRNVVLLSWTLSDFISPRFSLTWDITGDGNNVFKVGFGQFSDLLMFDMLHWFNQAGGNVFRSYNWVGPPMNPTEAQLRDTANWVFSWQQGSLTELAEPPMRFEEGVTPDKLTKFTVEFDRRLGQDWVLKFRGIYHDHPNMIEDLGYIDAVSSWYNIENWEEKRRRYIGFEFEANGRIGDKFFLTSSYVWSQAKGSTPGEWETSGNWDDWRSNNTAGVFGDHYSGPDDSIFAWRKAGSAGFGGKDYGDEGWYGFLPYACDHVVKILGTYLGPSNISISAGFEYYSGYHWSRMGFHTGYARYFTFPEGRGTETAPAHTYVDLSIQKDFPIKSGLTLGLRLNVTNLLNSQVPLSYMNGIGSLLEGEIYGRQFPRWFQIQVLMRF